LNLRKGKGNGVETHPSSVDVVVVVVVVVVEESLRCVSRSFLAPEPIAHRRCAGPGIWASATSMRVNNVYAFVD